MPPPEAAQEGPQGGWRLDHAAYNTDRPTSAQRIGVVDAVAASQRGSDLKALGLMRDVYLGTLYMDGMAIEATVEEVAA